jgi:dTDP-4-amino-4,6-dideoxygalactose transaminase
MIFASFAPNVEADDALLALKQLILPWNWQQLKKGKDQTKLKDQLEIFFGREAILTDSGRNALYQVLKGYQFPQDSEIIIQAFTCSVVPHAICRARLTPKYVDIDNNYNFDIKKLKKAISDKTKAIIVQHTFGIPANIQAIKELCEEKNIILIEDLALSLGLNINDQKAGTFGDSAILSFGSSKVISCSRGGAIITGNSELINEIKLAISHTEPDAPLSLIIQNLLQPIIFWTLKPLYNFLKIGKTGLYLCRKLKLLPTVVNQQEKNCSGNIPSYNLANSLAKIALNQWQKLNRFQKHRQTICAIYEKELQQNPSFGELSLLTYPVIVKNPKNIFKKTQKSDIILDDWYSQPIAPKDADQKACQYQAGLAPNAEAICSKLITLPTHIGISPKDANNIIQCLKSG